MTPSVFSNLSGFTDSSGCCGPLRVRGSIATSRSCRAGRDPRCSGTAGTGLGQGGPAAERHRNTEITESIRLEKTSEVPLESVCSVPAADYTKSDHNCDKLLAPLLFFQFVGGVEVNIVDLRFFTGPGVAGIAGRFCAWNGQQGRIFGTRPFCASLSPSADGSNGLGDRDPALHTRCHSLIRSSRSILC